MFGWLLNLFKWRSKDQEVLNWISKQRKEEKTKEYFIPPDDILNLVFTNYIFRRERKKKNKDLNIESPTMDVHPSPQERWEGW